MPTAPDLIVIPIGEFNLLPVVSSASNCISLLKLITVSLAESYVIVIEPVISLPSSITVKSFLVKFLTSKVHCLLL